MADNLLYDTKKDLIIMARMLPVIEINGKITNKYEDYDIDVLANEYCKATDENNEVDRNIYFSALILRFWYVIDRMCYKVRGTDFDRTDVFCRVYECIDVACHYRAWQDPNKQTNAQACINQVLASRGVPAMIAEYNQKRYMKITLSLDERVDDDDSYATRGDLIVDNSEIERKESEARTIDFIQSLIDDGKVIEAIIADTIANRDVYKYFSKLVKTKDEDGNEYNYTKISTEFWPFKLVKELNDLDENYYNYFATTYYIKDDKLQPARNALTKANNQKKYRYIDVTRETMKEYTHLLRS